ncbi:PREDICTED: C-type lectin domain family 10 member A [Cercocebus atys]|uniref:C-type lectin domain family 10 member A n=1 Tax=Cercocebus atys TaxID=9531 RepID=UPI0005F42A35|nr:PREDICTED: C-type lectin domain family 10 member A [Cercocebus atys]
MTYENFQDLESEEKVQGVRNGKRKGETLLKPLLKAPWAVFSTYVMSLNPLLTLARGPPSSCSVPLWARPPPAVPGLCLLIGGALWMQDLNKLTCQVATLKNNASTERTCCPVNWVEHQDSCYWFSRSAMPWAEAEKHCQLENAHLVVINSREEQNFVQEHLSFAYTWMGLSDREGAWKWVDGTDYETGFQNWKPGQPDDWQGHGLGGGEDCAHFHPDGRWNDDVCQRPYYWVCEAGLTQASQESH